ncbi:hypothetical protein [Dysgonomonas sp. 520]|uniref:hypothetical protein n=1 Tax=Dysgonomonas sp. 520 TaxID=2302931 RepID=UPI0013D757E9|nr:hypothetical protein [Dysgonomonas sp. 520]
MSKMGRYYQQQLDYIPYGEVQQDSNYPTPQEYEEYCEWVKQKELEDFENMR